MKKQQNNSTLARQIKNGIIEILVVKNWGLLSKKIN